MDSLQVPKLETTYRQRANRVWAGCHKKKAEEKIKETVPIESRPWTHHNMWWLCIRSLEGLKWCDISVHKQRFRCGRISAQRDWPSLASLFALVREGGRRDLSLSPQVAIITQQVEKPTPTKSPSTPLSFTAIPETEAIVTDIQILHSQPESSTTVTALPVTIQLPHTITLADVEQADAHAIPSTSSPIFTNIQWANNPRICSSSWKISQG